MSIDHFLITTTYKNWTGDFNFHVDVSDNRNALTFLEILDLYNLVQHVRGPTHKDGHTLDLVITRRNCKLVSPPKVDTRTLPSDHSAIRCNVDISRPGPSTKRIRSRRIRNINALEFRKDIRSSLESMSSITDLDIMVDGYNESLLKTLDEHAPEMERTVTLRPHAPWYNESLRIARQERRRRERKWLRSRLTVDKENYREQCETYKALLTKSKTDYHSKEVQNAGQRELFRVVDKLTCPKSTKNLPDHESPKQLSDSFAKFFSDKINRLRSGLESTTMPPVSVLISETCESSFSEFAEVTEADVLEAIRSASITSCPLDPLPIGVFKTCLEDLLPTITQIVRTSLSSGTFPTAYKHARIIPLLKKLNLDANILSNYRPISNLPFIGKIIERIAIQQLQTYLSENNLHARMQSAYRSFHSVETALLKVQNDILRALDKHQEALLLLLDFNAAFDTIDHNQLLNRLMSRYGVKGKVLQWISSYLSGRTQSIAIGNVLSDPVDLNCGVPQGSVAGPLIFTLFSAPLQDIIESHGLQSVVYADDTQIYFTFPPRDRLLAVQKIESCVADIRSWCQRNWLVLNDGKTELMYFTSKFIRNRTEWKPAIKIGNAIIQPSPLARNLGVIMDSSLNMSSHVNNVCKSAMFGIRKIGQIRQYLTQDSTAKLIHAFVTSKLDSCNSLLFGLMDRDVMKVQRVQNTAARLVLRVSRREHITPALESLHWLPIQQRAVYKILLITFKALRGMAPAFISDLLALYKPSRVLRSSSDCQLRVIKSSTKFYGERSYAFAAAKLWNKLPTSIRHATNPGIFKAKLKTHLFQLHFCVK